MENKRKKSKAAPVDPRFDEIARMFSDLEDQTDRMNDWEQNDFFPSVSDQFERSGELTDNQYNCLKKIHTRLC